MADTELAPGEPAADDLARLGPYAFDEPALHPAVLRLMAAQLDVLRSKVVIVERTSSLAPPPLLPPEPRRSLPVRAAEGGWKLSKRAAAVVGLATLLAEMLAPDSIVVRIVRAIFERT